MKPGQITTSLVQEKPSLLSKQEVKNVAVLLGDPNKSDPIKPLSVFDEDDLATIEELKKALATIKGYNFSYFTDHDTLILDLMKKKGEIDLILNLCDEGYNNDPHQELHVPALLELFSMHYTGSGPRCLAYCYDKALVRNLAQEIGVPVAKGFLLRPGDSLDKKGMSFPVILKPNFGDGGFGITQTSIAKSNEEVSTAISGIRKQFGYDKSILVEEFLTGKDLTLGVIGNPEGKVIVLPITEEDYSELPEHLPKIAGYESKWLPDSPYAKLKSRKAKIARGTARKMSEFSLRLFKRLGCRDYCRFDWRLDAEGNPRLLEANPNPGWCWDGHLANMARMKDISYPEMLGLIIESAESRRKD